jgi:acetolactate synthase-1/2/3 large subunit
MTVERADAVEEAIETAWDHDGSMLLDFRVEREVNVFPMVPVNKSIGEMMTEAPQPLTV